MDPCSRALGLLVPDFSPGDHLFIHPKHIGQLERHFPAAEPALLKALVHHLGDEARRHHALDHNIREAEFQGLLAIRVVVGLGTREHPAAPLVDGLVK